jgi:hypothetical protein
LMAQVHRTWRKECQTILRTNLKVLSLSNASLCLHESTGMIAAASSRRHICEFLSLCAQCHSYRMKYFIMRNNLISRVLRLLHSKHRHLHLGEPPHTRAWVSQDACSARASA